MDPDPDPGYFFKIYWIFLTKQNFEIFCLIFFAYFYVKTWWTIQKSGNFYNLTFFNSSDLGFESKIIFLCSFWLIFCPLDPDPWIQIFLRIRIQEAKILRIRILSTAEKYTPLHQVYELTFLTIDIRLLTGLGSFPTSWRVQVSKLAAWPTNSTLPPWTSVD